MMLSVLKDAVARGMAPPPSVVCWEPLAVCLESSCSCCRGGDLSRPVMLKGKDSKPEKRKRRFLLLIDWH